MNKPVLLGASIFRDIFTHSKAGFASSLSGRGSSTAAGSCPVLDGGGQSTNNPKSFLLLDGATTGGSIIDMQQKSSIYLCLSIDNIAIWNGRGLELWPRVV